MIGRLVALAAAAAIAAPGAAAAADGWPMARHDPGNSNRSATVSARSPALVPGWPIGGLVGPPLTTGGGIVALPDSVGTTAILNRDGTRRRTLPVGPIRAFGADGRIYAWPGSGEPVAAYTASGSPLWRSVPVTVGPQASEAALRVAPDGGVYVAGDSGLVALDPAGAVRWWQPLGLDDSEDALAVGPDGTVYFGVGAVSGPQVVARAADGRELWRRPLDGGARRVAVGSDGGVLVATAATLRSYGPDGAARWAAPVGAGLTGLAVGADGTAYVVETRGLERRDGLLVPGTVRAIAPDGAVRWAYRGRIAGRDPVIGGDGTIYVGGTPLVALRPDGARAWAFPPASRAIVPEAIGADGTLYAEGGGGAMLALAGPSARSRVTPPTPARQRTLIAQAGLRPVRFRMRGPASLCPVAGRPCRPATPLGATLRFTLTRDALVAVTVRCAGRAVAARVWRAGRGTTWSGLWDAIGYRTLAPGRYVLTVRAAAGHTRATTRPVAFTVVR